jgi:hypothetical protein
VTQRGKGLLDRPGSPTQPGAVKGEGHPQAKLAAVTHRFLDHLTEVTGADNDLINPIRRQEAKLMGDERLSVNVD